MNQFITTFGFDRAFNWIIFTFYVFASSFFFLFEWFSRTPKKSPKKKKKEIENDSKLLSFSFKIFLFSLTQFLWMRQLWAFEVVWWISLGVKSKYLYHNCLIMTRRIDGFNYRTFRLRFLISDSRIQANNIIDVNQSELSRLITYGRWGGQDLFCT